MKILLSFALIFGFAAAILGQTKTVDKKEKLSSVQSSIQLILLQKQKENAEKVLTELKLKYDGSYPEVIKTERQVETLAKSISVLSVLTPKTEAMQLIESDLSSDEMMKIIILQNEKIIELLTKIATQK